MEFETLANQHKNEVYRQMIRACGNREDAEDVLVEALVKAHRHLGQLRDAGAFRAWLARIARRVCWQLKEREALQPLLQLSVVEDEGREIPSQEQPLEQQVALRQMSSLLHEAIDKLSEEYRTVYTWRDLEDIPAKEVAKRLGISVAAVKSRLHRARESVRNALDAALLPRDTRKFLDKEAGVSPRQAGETRSREEWMEVTVEHLGALQFAIKARQHSIVSDQPAENGGFDEGMTPPELLVSALGSCAGFYTAQYLKKKGLATEGTVVRVFAGKVKNPARLDNFRIEVDVPAAVNEEHRKGVEEAVHHCLIHNTLQHPPAITLDVRPVLVATK